MIVDLIREPFEQFLIRAIQSSERGRMFESVPKLISDPPEAFNGQIGKGRQCVRAEWFSASLARQVFRYLGTGAGKCMN
jgi:hypothetical protein